jgi:hypothetical protein
MRWASIMKRERAFRKLMPRQGKELGAFIKGKVK